MITYSLLELIGNTPLLDLGPIVPEGSARLLAKLEMYNPGGSIKDRPAMAMITAAENAGLLKPGMTIVEPTAGNTGIGLAQVGNLKGYKTAFIVPDRMSAEKIAMMKLLGGEVILVPKEYSMPDCIKMAYDYAEKHGNCFVPQQFVNVENPNQAQFILGPEIFEQLGYCPDGLALGAGTGGTFTGMSRWLRSHNPDGVCWLVQPEGSVFKGGERGSYEIEGIGNSFIPETLEIGLADQIIDVADTDSFAACKLLARELGLLVGGSGGANLHASLQLCKQLGEGKTVVTIFADSMERYASKRWVKAMADGEL